MLDSPRRFLASGRAAWCGVLLALAACGDATGPADDPSLRADGPVIQTLPVLPRGAEEITLDGRTVRVGTARSWESDAVQVEMLGTTTLLQVDLADHELADWRVYASALQGQEFVVRIAGLDLMILQGGTQVQPEGLWPIGPRDSAEPRAQELLRRLAASAQTD